MKFFEATDKHVGFLLNPFRQTLTPDVCCFVVVMRNKKFVSKNDRTQIPADPVVTDSQTEEVKERVK